MKNLFKHEWLIRVTLGILIVAFAVHFQAYIWIILGLLLLYTGNREFCPIYHFLHVNSAKAKESFYISELPKYNPEPVFIYDIDGKLKFRNKNCSDEFIQKLNPIVSNLKEFSNNHKIKIGDKTYFINFEQSKEQNLILGYAFDVSDMIKLQQETISTQKEIVYKMGEIGETRSKETGNHVKRVAEYSYLLAKLSGLPEEDAQILKIASPMHDIGKVGIPDSILKKPGALDKDEWRTMKTHAKLGYSMLKNSNQPIIKVASIVAKEHHEKWDGSGYPDAIEGEDINIYGRITAIADVFDALGSKRVYKEAWELDKILELFKEQKGKHFDPKLVKLFFDNLEDFLVIRDRYRDA